jgi:hypothetical protein
MPKTVLFAEAISSLAEKRLDPVAARVDGKAKVINLVGLVL